MANKRFDNSSRGDKKPYSGNRDGDRTKKSGSYSDRPKRDWKEKSEGSVDRKTFKSKFTRKGSDSSAGDKPKFEGKKEGSRYSSSTPPTTRFGSRDGGEKRSSYGGDRTRGKDEGARPRTNPAFSSEKKYFKSKDGSASTGKDRDDSKKPFRREGPRFSDSSSAPHRGRGSKSFSPPRFGKPRKFTSGKKRDVMTEKPKDGLIRLNKFISNSGVCSRREADELIKMGLISVNGQVITEMGYKVKPNDDIRHESKKLYAEKPVYILMNKPKGFITTTDDPQERKTVMHLIGNTIKERVYPVGRLDRNTTGLLLLTNDGDLADKLTHPSYKAKKIYRVELDKPLTKADFDKIVEGVRLEEGKAMVDELAYVDDDKKSIGIEIHIGWNRIVRRIFESLEYEVVRLDRVVYAGLDKKNIGRGEWRYLNQDEVIKLKHLNKG